MKGLLQHVAPLAMSGKELETHVLGEMSPFFTVISKLLHEAESFLRS
jgi:hypothetical protein